MIRFRTLRTLTIAILVLVGVSFAAQHRTTKKKKPSAPAAPVPPTLQSCGVSLRIPPGWELMRASEYEKAHPETAPDDQSKSTAESTDEQETAQPVPTPQAEAPNPSESAPQTSSEPKPDNPCSFVISSKYPSAIVRNTDAEGPVGRMEIEIVNADLDTAATQLMEKDEKGWYVNGPNGTRYDARLNKPKKGLQTLIAVIVEACHDLNGKYRGLCESNRYVYSNGHRSALISAGPYLGETESSILTSLRFAPTDTKRSRSRPR